MSRIGVDFGGTKIEAAVLAADGAIAVRRVKKEDLKRIAKATGGSIVVTMAELADGGTVLDVSNYRTYINPTGKFVIGGPMGDAGVTGRKIIVDSYGGMARHGGGVEADHRATVVAERTRGEHHGLDPRGGQPRLRLHPDAPQPPHRQRVQELQLPTGRHDEQPVGLADSTGHLCQELAARRADGDRQAHLVADPLAQASSDLFRGAGDAAQTADVGALRAHQEHGCERVAVIDFVIFPPRTISPLRTYFSSPFSPH